MDQAQKARNSGRSGIPSKPPAHGARPATGKLRQLPGQRIFPVNISFPFPYCRKRGSAARPPNLAKCSREQNVSLMVTASPAEVDPPQMGPQLTFDEQPHSSSAQEPTSPALVRRVAQTRSDALARLTDHRVAVSPEKDITSTPHQWRTAGCCSTVRKAIRTQPCSLDSRMIIPNPCRCSLPASRGALSGSC